jgi:subtilisin family serine protease
MFDRRSTTLAVGMTIAATLVANAAAWAGGAYHKHFYNQQVPLDLDLTRVAIYQDLEAEPPPPPLGPILVAFGMNPQTVEPGPKPGWVTVTVPGWVQTGAHVELLVAQLADAAGLHFAGPVFLDAELEPLIPTPEILLRFHENVSHADQQETLAAAGAGTVLNETWGGMPDAWRLRNETKNGFLALEAANALAVLPTTSWAELNEFEVGELFDLPDDTYFDQSWRDLNYEQFGACVGSGSPVQDVDMDTAEAWTITTGDPDVKIAILDVGTELAHPDLNVEPGIDIYTYYPYFGGNGSPVNQCDNHGTGVTGVVSAINDNGKGVVGVAPDCVSGPVRIGRKDADADCMGWDVSDEYIVYGLLWAFGNGYRITVNSWGVSQSSAVQDAFEYYRSVGMLHFAATGNSGNSSIAFPASIPDVIAVGSLRCDNELAYDSNYGSGLDVVAPGDEIWTTDRTGSNGYNEDDAPGGNYVILRGTSLACPAAAGVAALIWSANTSLTADEVEQILIDTAVDLGTAGYDTTYGHGLVNAHQAVMEANSLLGSDRSFLISEIRTHDPADPDEQEYVEIYNTSTDPELLNNVSYAVIGDDAGDTDGIIDEFFELSPWYEQIDGHDFWTVATSTFTLGTADQTTTLAFENGDNVTHMLLLHASLTAGCDVDLNDDGVLDYTPWLKVLDSVALLEDSGSIPYTSEWWYADATIGPNGIGDAPGHVYRCNTTGWWEMGQSDPAVGVDTPDADNPACDGFWFGGLDHDLIEAGGQVIGNQLHLVGGSGGTDFGFSPKVGFSDFMCIELGDFVPGPMPSGAILRGTAIGVIGGMPGHVITSLQTEVTGTVLNLSAEFPEAGSTLQDVTLLDDGAVVGLYELVDQPVIAIGGPTVEPPILEFAPKPGELPLPLEAGGTFTFLQDVQVSLMGPQGAVTADQIVFRPSSGYTYDHLGRVNVIASNTPSFTVAGELVGKFGQAHRALGGARFMLAPDALGVEQLSDPEGTDGVRIELTVPASGFEIELMPMGQQPDGASLYADWGFTDANIASMHVTDAGNSLALYDERDLVQVTVQLYLDDVLQAEVQTTTPGVMARVLDDTAWPVGVLYYENLPGYGNGWDFAAPVPVQVADGPTMLGDRIRVVDTGLPAGPGGPPLIESVALTGFDVGPLTITNELAVASDPCPGDIDGDGSVGVTDFLAILAAWGTCPDPCPPSCPADLDGDCEVGVTDFLALLAVWGDCP